MNLAAFDLQQHAPTTTLSFQMHFFPLSYMSAMLPRMSLWTLVKPAQTSNKIIHHRNKCKHMNSCSPSKVSIHHSWWLLDHLWFAFCLCSPECIGGQMKLDKKKSIGDQMKLEKEKPLVINWNWTRKNQWTRLQTRGSPLLGFVRPSSFLSSFPSVASLSSVLWFLSIQTNKDNPD